MKTTTRTTNNLGLILEFLWAIIILGGITYLVFWKDASGWLYLGLLLANTSINSKKVDVKE